MLNSNTPPPLTVTFCVILLYPPPPPHLNTYFLNGPLRPFRFKSEWMNECPYVANLFTKRVTEFDLNWSKENYSRSVSSNDYISPNDPKGFQGEHTTTIEERVHFILVVLTMEFQETHSESWTPYNEQQ